MKKLLYEDVAVRIANYVRSNKLMPGTKLPGGRKLSKMLGVSKNTVYEALDYLRTESLLKTYNTTGTYVTENMWPDNFDPWEQFTNYKQHKHSETEVQKALTEATDDDFIISSTCLEKSFGYSNMLANTMSDVVDKLRYGNSMRQYNAYGLVSVRQALKKHLAGKGISASVDQMSL
jgi:DNA-binding transcriptional regulator YhcF (GntR family)